MEVGERGDRDRVNVMGLVEFDGIWGVIIKGDHNDSSNLWFRCIWKRNPDKVILLVGRRGMDGGVGGERLPVHFPIVLEVKYGA